MRSLDWFVEMVYTVDNQFQPVEGNAAAKKVARPTDTTADDDIDRAQLESLSADGLAKRRRVGSWIAVDTHKDEENNKEWLIRWKR